MAGVDAELAALAGLADELRQLIEKANAPIFGIDKEGKVNEWNYKVAEITGYTLPVWVAAAAKAALLALRGEPFEAEQQLELQA